MFSASQQVSRPFCYSKITFKRLNDGELLSLHGDGRHPSAAFLHPFLSLSLIGCRPEFWGPACNWASEGHGFLYSRRRGSALHLPGNKVFLGIHSSQKAYSLHTLTSWAVLSCVLVGRTVPQEDPKLTLTSFIWESKTLHAKAGDNPFSQTHFKKIS